MLLYETREHSNVTIRQKTSLWCTPHLHSRIEAGFIRKGRAQIILENKIYNAEEGDSFLIFPNPMKTTATSARTC